MKPHVLVFGVALLGCQTLAAGGSEDEPPASEAPSPSATPEPRACNVHELLANLEPGDSEEFPLPESLEDAYDFWRRIYGEWTHEEAILHKNASYEIKTDKDGNPVVHDGNTDYVIKYSNRSAAVLARRRGKPEYWRMQRGQRDRLEPAFQLWLRHRDAFDRAFEAEGAPVDASALGFIESMFDNTATSATGAQGVFQIQPWEAYKLGARMDASYNDLRDPRRAARLAARKLATDSKLLDAHARDHGVKDVKTTWPLALLSYNQGVNSMRRAVEDLETVQIDEVIEGHRGGQWGFAGKNFYPQFRVFFDLVHEAREKGCAASGGNLRIETFQLDAYVSLDDLARCCGVDRETLVELNPGLTEMARDGVVRLSKGLDLALPAGSREAFAQAYHGAETAPRKHDSQVRFASYRVHRGENLTIIARRTGTSLFSILQENEMTVEQANRIHPGASVRIPTRRFAELGQRLKQHPGPTVSFRLHRVRRGQTLRGIESAYGLSTGELKKWNDIDVNLPAGAVLAIPYDS